MYMFMGVVCALGIVTTLSASTIKLDADKESSTAGSMMHLEELLKNSLRKNNDDYPLEQQAEAERTLAPPGEPARRFNNIHTTTREEIIPTAPPTVGDALGLGINDMLMDNMDARKLAQHSKDKRAHKGQDMMVHTDKKHVTPDKSKRLFLYTSTPTIEPTSAPPSSRLITQPTHPHSKRLRQHMPTTAASTTAANIRNKYHNINAGRMLPLNAHRPGRTMAPLDRRPPNADQLDMAPARGAYIHDLRLKQRFCHRHVLWPEGPKYDSKGNTIMPAFDSKKYNGARKFEDTTKPLFVLPRCCNCCRKSVLGCQ